MVTRLAIHRLHDMNYVQYAQINSRSPPPPPKFPLPRRYKCSACRAALKSLPFCSAPAGQDRPHFAPMQRKNIRTTGGALDVTRRLRLGVLCTSHLPFFIESKSEGKSLVNKVAALAFLPLASFNYVTA
jgi:hypothetical protein